MTPEIIEDEVLGRMIWDITDEHWMRQVTLSSGLNVKVGFYTEPNPVPNEIAEGLVRARRPYLLVRDAEESIRRAASAFLLEIFNEGDWCEGKPLDEDAFIEKMMLESVALHEDGSANVYYDDGNLFWGHTIIVDINSDGVVEDADIAG